jgi:hypothetical protein
MLDEVELDLQHAALERDRPGGQAARRDIERDMPRMIEPRRQRKAHLADNLRP